MVQFLRHLNKIRYMKKLIISFLSFFLISVVYAQNNRATVLQDLETAQPASQETTLTATLKSASRLFGEKNDLTTVILIIPSGSVVDVLDSDSTYLHVVFDNNEGYIFKRQAVINESPIAQKPVAAQAEPQPVVSSQESRFTRLENKYGTSMAAKLISGKIWKGMSSEMVSDSWGTPQKINRVISGNTVKEEWIYKNTWLYIQDDVLENWGPIR
jgi:hypothetical protein